MAYHVMDEANRCLQCKVPQCQKGCPIHTPIPKVIELLRGGQMIEAGTMLYENNPLTSICPLVCNHERQCEGHCVLARKGMPVRFSVIERYISDTCAGKLQEEAMPSNGIRAAVVGSGPAGLTIAVILARKGYQVTIFEGKDKIFNAARQYALYHFRIDTISVRKFDLIQNRKSATGSATYIEHSSSGTKLILNGGYDLLQFRESLLNRHRHLLVLIIDVFDDFSYAFLFQMIIQRGLLCDS